MNIKREESAVGLSIQDAGPRPLMQHATYTVNSMSEIHIRVLAVKSILLYHTSIAIILYVL